MGFDNLLWHVDEGVTGLFGQWNAGSTVLFSLLIGLVTLFAYCRQDPDTHPMLLARQAQAAPVRQPGESPVYRSRSAPHALPLQAGLDVKDPGTSKWARGRDGDLRDIWRRAVAGVTVGGPRPGAGAIAAAAASATPATTAYPRLFAVYGTESVEETSLADVTRQINLVGRHMLDQGANRVAIYLPNSVELLAALFACSFYNMTAVLLPFDQSDDTLVHMLRRAAADTVITAPGCFPLATVAQRYPALRQLIWVVDEGSKHLDWNEVPEGVGGAVNVATWQDIVGDAAATAGRDLPPLEGQSAPRDITVFWEPAAAGGSADNSTAPKTTAAPTTTAPDTHTAPPMACLTSGNLAAAVAAQISALPAAQRLGPSDLLLAADSLTHAHTLSLVLAALYSGASVALSSAAPAAPDLETATRGVAPTVLVATPAALRATHAAAAATLAQKLPCAAWLLHWQTRALADGGALPSAASLVSRLLDRARPAIGTTPGRLRLLYTAERVGAGTPPLSSAVLSDLRIFTGARLIYALAASKVAGAAAQTGLYDYRVVSSGAYAPFGAPVASTEYLLRDAGAYKTTDDKIEGEIIIRGPSVASDEAALGVMGVIRDDNTLAYV